MVILLCDWTKTLGEFSSNFYSIISADLKIQRECRSHLRNKSYSSKMPYSHDLDEQELTENCANSLGSNI